MIAKRMVAGAAAVALVAAACGSSGSSGGSGSSSSAGSTVQTAATTPSGGLPQGGTVKMVAQSPEDPWDGQAYYGTQWEVEYLTCNALMDYVPSATSGNPALIPGIAADMPQILHGGKTYTFTIRQGLKYSDGTVLQAQDVKDMFERFLDPAMGQSGALGAGYYNEIVGMDKYAPTGATKAGAAHISGITVSGNTVTFNLVKADPDFVAKLSLRFTCIYKPGGPHKRSQMPQPSTGPYMITTATNTNVVLVRNPYWWSNNAAILGMAQYKGRLWNADSYTLTIGLSPDQQLLQLKANQVDLSWDSTAVGGVAQVKQLEAGADTKSRFFQPTTLYLDYMSLNTAKGPFTNAKLRQAANYAIDRQAIATISGHDVPWSVLEATPLAPKAPVVYPPASNDATAKQLIAQSGLKTPIPVTLLYFSQSGTAPQQASATAAQLEAVGFKVTLVSKPPQVYYEYAASAANAHDIMQGVWSPDWPDGSSAMGPILLAAGIGGQNLAENNDPAFEAQYAQIDNMPYGPARTAAWAALAASYAQTRAPLVVTGTRFQPDLTSARLGGYSWDPAHSVNLGAMYIKP